MTNFQDKPLLPKRLVSSRNITEKTKLLCSPKTPPTSVGDLAQMMEIDLTLMGDERAFRRRLIKVLNATEAFWQAKGRC